MKHLKTLESCSTSDKIKSYKEGYNKCIDEILKFIEEPENWLFYQDSPDTSGTSIDKDKLEEKLNSLKKEMKMTTTYQQVLSSD